MNEKKMTVLVTGATGLLGSYLIKVLLEDGHKVYCLSRAKEGISAQQRVFNVLDFWDGSLLAGHKDRLTVFEGDITEDDLGLGVQEKAVLQKEVDQIFHCAAVINFNWSLEKIRKTNVEGTEKVFLFASDCKKSGQFKKVNFISTAYVFTGEKGVFSEDAPAPSLHSPLSYVQSKREAEKIAEKFREKGLWIDVYRAPFIIGESGSGKTPVPGQVIYQILHICGMNIFDCFPGKNKFLYAVFVDDLAASILSLSTRDNMRSQTYHPFCDTPITIDDIFSWAEKCSDIRMPELVPLEGFDVSGLTPAQKVILSYNSFLLTKMDFSLNSDKTMALLKDDNIIPKVDQERFCNLIRFALHGNRTIRQ